MSEINQRKEVNICKHVLNSSEFKYINLVDIIKKKIHHS
jgi:hypothetical protein